MGRMVQGFASMQAAVNRIENKLERVATKEDIADVRAMAQQAIDKAAAANDKANAANARLDGLSPWRQIGIAVLIMFIAGGLALMGLKS